MATVNPVDALNDYINKNTDPGDFRNVEPLGLAKKMQELGGLTPDLINVLVQRFDANPKSVVTAYNEVLDPNAIPYNAHFLTNRNPKNHVAGPAAGFNIGQVASIALAVAFPGAGAALGADLGVSEIVGKAIINAAIGVASGQPIETALQNATIDAVTQTGSADVAKDIASTVGKVGAEAISGAGGSIAATFAKGGTMEDALTNATGSIVAAGTRDITGSDVAASAAGGAITGGATGAVTGAAGTYFGQKDTTKKADTTALTEVPINDMTAGVQVAGPGGFQDLMPGQINVTATGTYFGNVPVVIDSKTGQIISATGSAQDIETLRQGNVSTLRVDTSKINPVFLDKSPLNPNLSSEELNALKGVAKADAARNALKTGKFDEYFNTYGGSPAGDPVYKQMLEEALANDPTNQTYLEEYKRLSGQDYVPSTTSSGTAPVADLGTIEIVGQKPTEYKSAADVYQAILGRQPENKDVENAWNTYFAGDITKEKLDAFKTAAAPELAITGYKPPTTGGGGGGGDVGGAPPSGGGPTDRTPVTPTDTATITPTDTSTYDYGGDSGGGEAAPPPPPKDTTPITDKPYIYSGISPTTKPSTLTTTFGGVGTSPLQQALTSYRPAGEIEDVSTGKKRENVWNEASLRLKDALGI